MTQKTITPTTYRTRVKILVQSLQKFVKKSVKRSAQPQPPQPHPEEPWQLQQLQQKTKVKINYISENP